MQTSQNVKISVAIPTFNSSNYLTMCINSILNNKVVSEIVIHDDCSEKDEYKKIVEISNKFKNEIKIKVFRSEKNYGAFINKFKNINECSNEIVYQLDSDNASYLNLDHIINRIYLKNKTNDLYIPSKIYQFHKHPKGSRFLSKFNKKYKVIYTIDDFTFTKKVIQQEINNEAKYTIDKNINWVLNSGNFICYKDQYIQTIKDKIDLNIRYPLDAVAISYFWIENGGSINTLKNFYHFHRKRSDSVSFTENEGSYESLQYFRQKFLDL